jgi:hypothetical protein
MARSRSASAIAAVRRKSALLAAGSLLLAAIGLQAYASGYPLGMSMLAASTVQAGVCSAMFRSRLLMSVLAANLLLFLFHALLISRYLAAASAPAVFQLGDFCCAVIGSASLVFTPVETMALIVREAYLRRPRRRAPR